jgi:hypothetical protein
VLKYLKSIAAAAALAATVSPSSAAPIGLSPDLPSMTIEVSGGCGPHAWRGPWGHCRDTPYYGRLPNGSYKMPGAWNGCRPGSWRGPYGHCRDTPFHGRLPDGQRV